jgi:hypothetical protein
MGNSGVAALRSSNSLRKFFNDAHRTCQPGDPDHLQRADREQYFIHHVQRGMESWQTIATPAPALRALYSLRSHRELGPWN